MEAGVPQDGSGGPIEAGVTVVEGDDHLFLGKRGGSVDTLGQFFHGERTEVVFGQPLHVRSEEIERRGERRRHFSPYRFDTVVQEYRNRP